MLRGPTPAKTYELIKVETTIGSDMNNDIVINDPNITGKHAHIIESLNEYVLVDLNSPQGTFVNDRRLTSPHTLILGDRVMFGVNIILLYEEKPEKPSTERIKENVKEDNRDQDVRNPSVDSSASQNISMGGKGQRWLYSRLYFQMGAEPGSIPLLAQEKVSESLDFEVFGDPNSYRNYPPSKTGEIIAWLGNNGWELVSVTDTYAKFTEQHHLKITVWYFKKLI
jgi:pSer/pThr/pTyr-binding forkhead associated (FHA) protein